MALQLSDEQQQLLQQQLQALSTEYKQSQGEALTIQSPQPAIRIHPDIRQAFEATLKGEPSRLFEQLGVNIDPSKFAPQRPAFRQPTEQKLQVGFPVSEEKLDEEKHDEDTGFFKEFLSAEEKLPPRNLDELANITSESIRDLGIEPFETDQYNTNLVANTIRENLSMGDIVNDDKLFSEIQDILEIGVSQALSSNDQQINITKVFSTLAQALRNIGADANNPKLISEIIDKAAFGLISKQGLEDLSFIPQEDIDMDFSVEALFGDALNKAINRPNISISEVRKIARDFSKELKEKVDQGATQQTFKNIVAWIDRNVANPTLKAALRSQARMFEVELIRIKSAQQIQGVPELIPLAEGRGILLNRDVALNFSNELEKVLNKVSELPSEQIGPKLNKLVDKTNEVIRELHIHAIRDGRSVLPTISKTDLDGKRKSPLVIVRELQALARELPSPVSQFTFLPMISEGKPLDTRSIIRDLHNRFSKQTKKSKSDRRVISSKGFTKSKFGKISIITQRGEYSKNLEIVIPPNASIEDLLKLIQALLQEDGQLNDVDDMPLIKIQRGITTLSDVLAAIRKEQKEMLGVEIHLSYHPSDPVGGMYLGGSLSNLLKVPLHTAMNNHIPPSGIPKLHPAIHMLSIPFHKLHQPIGGALKLSDNPSNSPGPSNSPNSSELEYRAGRFDEPQFHIQITPQSEQQLNSVRFSEDRVLSNDSSAEQFGGNIFSDIIGTIGSVVSAPFQVVGSLLGGELDSHTVKEMELDSRRSIAAR